MMIASELSRFSTNEIWFSSTFVALWCTHLLFHFLPLIFVGSSRVWRCAVYRPFIIDMIFRRETFPFTIVVLCFIKCAHKKPSKSQSETCQLTWHTVMWYIPFWITSALCVRGSRKQWAERKSTHMTRMRERRMFGSTFRILWLRVVKEHSCDCMAFRLTMCCYDDFC